MDKTDHITHACLGNYSKPSLNLVYLFCENDVKLNGLHSAYSKWMLKFYKGSPGRKEIVTHAVKLREKPEDICE